MPASIVPPSGEAFEGLAGLLAVSMAAQEFFEGTLGWITNSIFVAAVVMCLILFLATRATRKMELIPHGAQNFWEFIVEFLYGQVEGIVGKHVAPRAFPLLATLFIFILVSNWFGLVPGVGTVGWGDRAGPITVSYVSTPLLRPAMADLNMTLALSMCAMAVWLILTMKEIGVWGFIVHTFGPKGGLKGAMLYALMPIFIFVGVIELISIGFRPVSLSLRLFGNLFAGENLLHTMMVLGEDWGPVGAFLSGVAFPLPFYFLELLVGLLQAIVFALLVAVYIKLTTTHEEH